jgi:hypothetical protein
LLPALPQPSTSSDALPPNPGEYQVGRNIWPCILCNLRFPGPNDAKAHCRLEHGERMLVWGCDHCAERYDSNVVLVAHIAKDHSAQAQGLRCPAWDSERGIRCQTRKNTYHSLRQHVRNTHETAVFSCAEPGCDATFATKQRLEQHSASHKDMSLRKVHVCSEADCMEAFTTRKALKKHMRKKHP